MAVASHVKTTLPAAPSRWELAAEAVAVKIRWFGLLFGYLLVNVLGPAGHKQGLLNAILTLGAAYTLLDTLHSLRGRVFLGTHPLAVSVMETLFIALLCFLHEGLGSPFRYYYFLSLICCAIRHPSQVTYATCALHCLSYGLLYLALPAEQRQPSAVVLLIVVLGWLTWASNALALLLKRVGNYLGELNDSLQVQQLRLEERIAERTRELREAQATVLHQEKMAAFGLLAAGIAHEVGNPLTAVSSLVQMLQKRQCDEYTAEKLTLVSGQLQRIHTTLRELVQFSRPDTGPATLVSLRDVLSEALAVARFYKRTGGRVRLGTVPDVLLRGQRGQLVQVFLNLILNAIDAIENRAGASVEVESSDDGRLAEVQVSDDGCGIPEEHRARLFQPYFTTKPNGTGLGLFVTRKMIEAHGGSLEYFPRPAGGSRFRVRLPLAREESSCSDAESSSLTTRS